MRQREGLWEQLQSGNVGCDGAEEETQWLRLSSVCEKKETEG